MSESSQISAFQRLDARTTTSGYLRAEDVAILAGLGVRHVINLAPDNLPGSLANERRHVARAGMRYTHIPVPFDAPDDSHFAAFRAAYEGDDEPVHVHCVMNYRVSAFFCRYNRAVRGMDKDRARALMEVQWSPEASEYRDAWIGFIEADA